MAGFTLFEVLLAWCIVFGLLVWVLLFQLQGERSAHQIWNRTVATNQIFSFFERLRVNTSWGARFREWRTWNRETHTLLPQGVGDFTCDSQDVCHVTVRWGHSPVKSLMEEGIP